MHNHLIIQMMFFWSMVGGLAYSQVVDPVVSTSPTGGNADDPAIWIHPTDPARSVVIGTDKDAGVYVWNMDGTNEKQGRVASGLYLYRMQTPGFVSNRKLVLAQ
jgi:hypothetical protein